MTELSGLLKFTWLKALKNSERNWNWYRSLKGKTLRIAKSVLLKAGPLRMFRPVAPYCPSKEYLIPKGVQLLCSMYCGFPCAATLS